MNIIEIKNLKKYYGTHKGVEHINLNITEGSFFGFIGPNGAGKSTTIRCLLGLLNIDEGSISIFNKDLKTNKEEILKDIGYLPSELTFYSGMKVKEVIDYSASLFKKNCSEEAKRICDILELDLNKKVDDLSLGNKKKVGIVCALQHNPKLLILDEPTSGLDPLIQKKFFDLLIEKKKQGATIFLSSHNLAEVKKYCENVVIIKDGNIIRVDEVSNITVTGVKKIYLKNCNNEINYPGIKNINKTTDGIDFLFNGDIKELLNYLQTIDFEDISINDSDFEEMFMHYYESEVK